MNHHELKNRAPAEICYPNQIVDVYTFQNERVNNVTQNEYLY